MRSGYRETLPSIDVPEIGRDAPAINDMPPRDPYSTGARSSCSKACVGGHDLQGTEVCPRTSCLPPSSRSCHQPTVRCSTNEVRVHSMTCGLLLPQDYRVVCLVLYQTIQLHGYTHTCSRVASPRFLARPLRIGRSPSKDSIHVLAADPRTCHEQKGATMHVRLLRHYQTMISAGGQDRRS